MRDGYSRLLGFFDYARRYGVEEGVEKESFMASSLSLYHSGY